MIQVSSFPAVRLPVDNPAPAAADMAAAALNPALDNLCDGTFPPAAN